MKEVKINNKHNLIIASVFLFFILSATLVISAVLNSSQAEWAIIPDIRLVGEYKIGDGEWNKIVEGEHISATKGDVRLKGILKICAPDTNEILGTVENGSLLLFNFNHINLTLTENNQPVLVCDMENPDFGEDLCGDTYCVVEYFGENGYFEATVRNNHHFGNETAIDELLSSMKLYASDYSEKIALRSGQNERVLAIIIIICAFIVLGATIFSALLYKDIFRTSFFGGLLILSAGIFFLFTSKALYFWSDKVVLNTMMSILSAMAYSLFALLLMKSLVSEKMQKAANIITLLYSAFVSIVITSSLFSEIYFYDVLGVWAVGAAVASAVFLILALLSLKNVSGKQKISLLFISLGVLVFIADIISVKFGLWQTGLLSKIFFLIGFIVATFVFLRIVPKNIKAAQKAEKLEKEKITLDAELTRSRISTLMSQIHPHFIYNTLGSIEQLCELDPPKAAKLVNDFSKYLRGNFSEIDNPKLIRVSKELEHTEYYIGIEKVRFPDIDFITEMNVLGQLGAFSDKEDE